MSFEEEYLLSSVKKAMKQGPLKEPEEKHCTSCAKTQPGYFFPKGRYIMSDECAECLGTSRDFRALEQRYLDLEDRVTDSIENEGRVNSELLRAKRNKRYYEKHKARIMAQRKAARAKRRETKQDCLKIAEALIAELGPRLERYDDVMPVQDPSTGCIIPRCVFYRGVHDITEHLLAHIGRQAKKTGVGNTPTS